MLGDHHECQAHGERVSREDGNEKVILIHIDLKGEENGQLEDSA
jgi:hypothetical protein